MFNIKDNEALVLSVLNYIKNEGSFDEPLPRKLITRRFGLSKRNVENIVEYLLVEKGHPILAKKGLNDHGYFIPKNDEEREIAIGAYRKQIETSLRNLNLKMNINLQEYWDIVEN